MGQNYFEVTVYPYVAMLYIDIYIYIGNVKPMFDLQWLPIAYFIRHDNDNETTA